MSLLFYSAIGRQGKTTHAVGYAKYAGAKFFTNDIQNATKELYSNLFPISHFTEISVGESINIDDDDRIVFDFGGYIDSRLIDVIKYVKLCVVPISYQSKSEYIPTIRTINAIAEHNKNIVILINNTNKNLVYDVEMSLKEIYKDLPIFTVDASRYISRLANYQKTIFDLLSVGGGLERYMLNKSVVPQIKNFYNYLDNKMDRKS